MVTKIISGGQTGADQGGLQGAKDAGIATGGYAPLNFLTDDGYQPDLAEKYGLVDSGLGYLGRTELNVKNSDVTIWFGNTISPGYHATRKAMHKFQKNMYVFSELSGGLDTVVVIFKGYDVINIAGNRERKNPGIFEITRAVVKNALELVRVEETGSRECPR
jgi:hypothetical protein